MLCSEASGGEGKNPKTVWLEAKGDVSRLGMGASCPRSQAIVAITIAPTMHILRFTSGPPFGHGAVRRVPARATSARRASAWRASRCGSPGSAHAARVVLARDDLGLDRPDPP